MSRKPGSCGTVQHTCTIRLDPVTGEMQSYGPLLCDGYFDNPEATAEAFTEDGWFRTGDVASLDDEGFYAIVGRVKDVIRTGGESVAPAEVEAAIADHPALVDVAVVGMPDPKWGEVVCVAVVVRAGAAVPSLEAIHEHVETRLAKFKRPRRLEVVDKIPRTPATNQVQRRLLVEHLASR
jgi:acyl-CoA synthetase (AMP-forming)/AMP-acid ligase II